MTDEELIRRAREGWESGIYPHEYENPMLAAGDALFRAVDERDALRKRIKQLEHGYDVLRTTANRLRNRVAELEAR